MNMKTWRNLHRWTGLALVGFVAFYCFTGLLLNHRQAFDYFIDKEITVTAVPVSDPVVLRDFIETYKRQINRSDDPKVIRIRDGRQIEFLYGSHGKTTYVIDPARGTMETVEKIDRQPWLWLNNVHNAFKTSWLWVAVADGAALGIFFLGLSGLLIFRYKVWDYWLLGGGVVVLVVALFLA
ncbi:MAG: PepSY domain-containing protein [Desulfobulbaceae bacterium]|nr:PepSY domain-containing protein [Desulfobulbaceae bacterium]HIJ79227.1 hypothetical protein [Deltaproteobacteria bacterium]